MKLKDGRTRLAYKSEHVVDMDTGVVVAAEIYPADQADTATMEPSLRAARANIEDAKSAADDESDDDNDRSGNADSSGNDGRAQSDDDSGSSSDSATAFAWMEVVADKGYHKAELLLDLKQSRCRTYIPERDNSGRKWTDKNWEMQQAFYANRTRVRRPKSRALQRKRGELIERTFAHACETGALRRIRLRGRDNVRKRYLSHIAALNLAIRIAQSARGRHAAWRGRGPEGLFCPCFGVLGCPYGDGSASARLDVMEHSSRYVGGAVLHWPRWDGSCIPERGLLNGLLSGEWHCVRKTIGMIVGPHFKACARSVRRSSPENLVYPQHLIG